jgi:membrane protein implicated in regulation of membrane protease activity
MHKYLNLKIFILIFSFCLNYFYGGGEIFSLSKVEAQDEINSKEDKNENKNNHIQKNDQIKDIEKFQQSLSLFVLATILITLEFILPTLGLLGIFGFYGLTTGIILFSESIGYPLEISFGFWISVFLAFGTFALIFYYVKKKSSKEVSLKSMDLLGKKALIISRTPEKDFKNKNFYQLKVGNEIWNGYSESSSNLFDAGKLVEIIDVDTNKLLVKIKEL